MKTRTLKTTKPKARKYDDDGDDLETARRVKSAKKKKRSEPEDEPLTDEDRLGFDWGEYQRLIHSRR
jgi:hypothetical protein